ncbi:hypothetical protein F5Y09DRAFT_343460 [Xylaria sp. FL1042]|nr:hypothetical protein F5Y09DRAFT_343460 [Xylaria sp. FL1042]
MPSTEDIISSFLPFWTDMRNVMRRAQFLRTVEGLSQVLPGILAMPQIKLYTPQFLAFEAFRASAKIFVDGYDSWTGYYRTVNNTWKYGVTVFPDLEKLQYCLDHEKHVSGELLLDILEGGCTTGHREEIATILDPPGLRPGNSVVYGCHQNEIRIPKLINIKQDIEPYLSYVRERPGVTLVLRKDRRMFVFEPSFHLPFHTEYRKENGTCALRLIRQLRRYTIVMASTGSGRRSKTLFLHPHDDKFLEGSGLGRFGSRVDRLVAAKLTATGGLTREMPTDAHYISQDGRIAVRDASMCEGAVQRHDTPIQQEQGQDEPGQGVEKKDENG